MPNNWEEIKSIVLDVLAELIKKSRGTAIYFTPKKIARLANFPDKPLVYHMVKTVIHELSLKYGIMTWDERKNLYYINKASPIWMLVKREK